MLSAMNQKATILIVALIVGKSLPTHEAMLYLVGGIALLWALYYQSSILLFLKRLYSPAPRGAVQPRPMPLCYVFDPETNTMTGVPRAALMQLLDGRKDSPYV
jgi:hypothetical protein